MKLIDGTVLSSQADITGTSWFISMHHLLADSHPQENLIFILGVGYLNNSPGGELIDIEDGVSTA